MIFRAALFITYLLLRWAFRLTALLDPSFRARLAEKDFSFAVRSSAGHAAGTFMLRGGGLSYREGVEGSADFSAAWNGWGDADTLQKKLRLHPTDFMNRGMMTFEGDLSCMDYLLVLLGEMIAGFRGRKPARLRRAELGGKPS